DCAGLTADAAPAMLMGQLAGFGRRDSPLVRGALETAHGNSLVLEDLPALAPDVQGLILRFAETGILQRIGALEGRDIDARLIATSALGPDQLLQGHVLRRDLFFRINEFHISLPPLRDRRDDIAELARHFAQDLTHRSDVTFTNAALRVLIEHDWPGNVRELRNLMRRVLIHTKSTRVTAQDVDFIAVAGAANPARQAGPETPVETTSEREWIADALKRHNYRRGPTARHLGLSLRTLYNKIQKYQLE
ncbi:MAG: sigma 54-interacting transcriptional regulator, partial [Rhodobacteraceae bacterium]|nr:sigma 54-interacting transcriptional regulator [Paracoccaceae bacterium]